MALSVKIESFEGPLDPLLHLIDINKFNIFDIPIVEITEQYMEYLRSMETKDLNVMSEFLVMAATLLEIKAKMLLPAEVNEEGEEVDPREELVQKLLEYKMYKYMSYELKDRMADAELMMYHAGGLPREVAEYRAPVDTGHLTDGLTLQRLHEIFRDVLRRQENKRDPIRSNFGKIEKEEISLPDKMAHVRAYARKHDHFTFRALLASQHSRTQVVVTFLAVLELMRSGGIRLTQEEAFGEIYIETVKEAIDDDRESA